jgi:hypothetical protein
LPGRINAACHRALLKNGSPHGMIGLSPPQSRELSDKDNYS